MVMRKLFASAFCFIFAAQLFAQFNARSVPDSAEIRSAVKESWLYGDLGSLREKLMELRANAVGQEFQIRMEENDTSFAVIVAPQVKTEMDFYTENGIERRTVDEYPGDACGSWILMRSLLTGEPELIRIYFSANSDMYVQFRPDGRKCVADFVVSGLYASRASPVGIPFESLYTASFQQIFSITSYTLPWHLADSKQGQFGSKLQMIGVIRKNIGRFVYAQDTCQNEEGKSVSISTGDILDMSESEQKAEADGVENPVFGDQAGFVKWIVDGLVEPLAGSRLYREPLLARTVEYNATGLNGVLSQTEDLSFTLDWCRNLAAACLSIKTHRNYMWSEANTDVQTEPFSMSVSENGIVQTAGYLKDSGYQTEALRPLLFVLASAEPTYCYLAAVKRPFKPENSASPDYFVFDQCAVIIPFFNDNGVFSCVVFENGQELSLKEFAAKYKGCFVHLSRVLTEDNFFLE